MDANDISTINDAYLQFSSYNSSIVHFLNATDKKINHLDESFKNLSDIIATIRSNDQTPQTIQNSNDELSGIQNLHQNIELHDKKLCSIQSSYDTLELDFKALENKVMALDEVVRILKDSNMNPSNQSYTEETIPTDDEKKYETSDDFVEDFQVTKSVDYSVPLSIPEVIPTNPTKVNENETEDIRHQNYSITEIEESHIDYSEDIKDVDVEYILKKQSKSIKSLNMLRDTEDISSRLFHIEAALGQQNSFNHQILHLFNNMKEDFTKFKENMITNNTEVKEIKLCVSSNSDSIMNLRESLKNMETDLSSLHHQFNIIQEEMNHVISMSSLNEITEQSHKLSNTNTTCDITFSEISNKEQLTTSPDIELLLNRVDTIEKSYLSMNSRFDKLNFKIDKILQIDFENKKPEITDSDNSLKARIASLELELFQLVEYLKESLLRNIEYEALDTRTNDIETLEKVIAMSFNSNIPLVNRLAKFASLVENSKDIFKLQNSGSETLKTLFPKLDEISLELDNLMDFIKECKNSRGAVYKTYEQLFYSEDMDSKDIQDDMKTLSSKMINLLSEFDDKLLIHRKINKLEELIHRKVDISFVKSSDYEMRLLLTEKVDKEQLRVFDNKKANITDLEQLKVLFNQKIDKVSNDNLLLVRDKTDVNTNGNEEIEKLNKRQEVLQNLISDLQYSTRENIARGEIESAMKILISELKELKLKAVTNDIFHEGLKSKANVQDLHSFMFKLSEALEAVGLNNIDTNSSSNFASATRVKCLVCEKPVITPTSPPENSNPRPFTTGYSKRDTEESKRSSQSDYSDLLIMKKSISQLPEIQDNNLKASRIRTSSGGGFQANIKRDTR